MFTEAQRFGVGICIWFVIGASAYVYSTLKWGHHHDGWKVDLAFFILNTIMGPLSWICMVLAFISLPDKNKHG